jgi:phosphatidylethanolamine/phosphatidyl-N-methylethanolamine N-methyltransferase
VIASHIDPGSSIVLEVGAGTGSLTNAILDRGIDPRRLFLIERDPCLAAYLRDRFPRVRVRCADAVHAGNILSRESVGDVHTVLSSLPIRNLQAWQRIATVRALMKALAPGGQLIQYTYGRNCPIPSAALGLHAECIERVWRNLPPAAVWRFTRNPEEHTR